MKLEQNKRLCYTIVQEKNSLTYFNLFRRITVSAIIVAKRENITHHQYANAGDVSGAHGFYTTTNTMYYVTFQMESGDRMEFQVSGIEYGMLAEGDTGELTFQGTRYLAFER